ncbi:MAG: fimbrial protein [Providencia sp.]|uniref:fimbrial protein n=1 Tax=Providencia sp. TaxID=589 RepID=UPI003F95EA85
MKKHIYLWTAFLLSPLNSYAIEPNVGHVQDGLSGEAVIQGYIVAAPCSIETGSQYQYINYDYISNINEIENRKITRKPFYIKLNNCISEYDNNNHKGIKIRFFAPQDIESNAIKLSGPQSGVVLYIYDNNNKLLMPNELYSISDNYIYFDHKSKESYLKYETELGTSNNEIVPGDYFATIKFNVTYD